MLKSVIHFELIFCELCKVGIQFYLSACGFPVFPKSFVEETILSPLSALGSLVKY